MGGIWQALAGTETIDTLSMTLEFRVDTALGRQKGGRWKKKIAPA